MSNKGTMDQRARLRVINDTQFDNLFLPCCEFFAKFWRRVIYGTGSTLIKI